MTKKVKITIDSIAMNNEHSRVAQCRQLTMNNEEFVQEECPFRFVQRRCSQCITLVTKLSM